MAWFGWGRGGGWRWGWRGPWPGRGPFSHLPPWHRPGWIFGRGACWWLFGMPWGLRWWHPWTTYYPYVAPWMYYMWWRIPAYYPYYYPYYPYPWW